MAANTTPIYSIAGRVQWSTNIIKTANTAKDGTGSADIIFTAGAN